MTIEQIKNNEVYKEVLKDSMGGLMYNVANRDKYDSAEIVAAWDALPPAERERAGGIMKGAMNFLKGN